jgi:hypothetical protein
MIDISKVKEIREALGLTHLVLFGVTPDGQQFVSTHGQTEQHAREAAVAGNKLKASLGWPENLCKDRPLERICKNCVYYEGDYGIHCMNGWSQDGSFGKCVVDPVKTPRAARDHSCGLFEPNR